MIEIEYEGNTYGYCRDNKKGHWLGIKGKRNPMFPGAQISVPIGFYPALLKKALEDGHKPSVFRSPKKEKKVRAARVRAKKEVGIKIF